MGSVTGLINDLEEALEIQKAITAAEMRENTRLRERIAELEASTACPYCKSGVGDEITRLREALIDYGQHDSGCIAGQWRSGTPTEDGNYETVFGHGKNEVRCLRGERPPCTCGLDEILAEGENDEST